MPYCAACDTTYTPLDDMRFWSGEFRANDNANVPEGTFLEKVCERCKRNNRVRRTSGT